jgi:hypothetical protein
MDKNNYTLSIKINKASTDLNGDDVSLSFSDSIYELYPKASIQFVDSSGLFLESRITTAGIHFDFSVGYNSKILNLPFLVNYFETPDQLDSNSLNGTILINLIHSFYNSTSNLPKAYSKTTSDIITELISGFKFLKTDVESTVSLQDSPYYNPMLTFEDFVKNIILPNSISNQNKADPFFCFINSRNEFYFKSFTSLTKNSSGITLFFKKGRKGNPNEKIMVFRPFSEPFSQVRDTTNFSQSFFDEDSNGDFTTEERSILDDGITPYPIIKLEEQTISQFDGFKDEMGVLRESVKINLKKKKSLLVEKIFIITLLNTELAAGKTVSIETDYLQKDQSLVYSGNYLIEKSTHSWDPESRLGYTRLIVSRKKAIAPSGTLIKEGLLS